MKQAKMINLIGRNRDTHEIEAIKDFLIIRKGIEKRHIRGYNRVYKFDIKNTKYAVMVSSPYLFRSVFAGQHANLWFHPFRNPDKYLPKNATGILLSESDFIDPIFVPVLPRAEKTKWDYFYFTIGGGDGVSFKGFKLFLDILPTLNAAGLRGVVIVYGKSPKMPKSSYLFMIENNVKVMRKGMSYKDVGSLMARCKFGLFPNIKDCSPRMLTETLVRDVPVLVNDAILGGWKYINDNTGVFFNKDNIVESLQKILNNKFSPREDFMKNYGFINASARFANLLNSHWPLIFHKYDMVSFSDFKKVMNSRGVKDARIQIP